MLLMPIFGNRDKELAQYNPFEEMDKVLNELWGEATNPFPQMRTDVVDEGKEYRLMAELPGFSREDIKAEIRDGVLTIEASKKPAGEKTENAGEGEAQVQEAPAPRYVRRERRNLSYKRTFTIGDDVRAEDISGRYENGVLTLVLPKKEAEPEDKTARIEIL